MATPMAHYFAGTTKFDPQLEADHTATLWARDSQTAASFLDDALDYVSLLSDDLRVKPRGDESAEEEEEREEQVKMLEAALNLAGAALEFLREQH